MIGLPVVSDEMHDSRKPVPAVGVRSIADIERISDHALDEDLLCRVPHATPILVDREAILRDFPWVSRMSRRYDSSDGVSRWISAAGGLLSTAHVPRSDVNEEVKASSVFAKGYRPPRYGRSAIVESRRFVGNDVDNDTRCRGLVDVKGCGVRSGVTPVRARRRNGLLLLPEAIQELLNYRVLQRVFSDSGTDVRCLPLYGLVSLRINGLSEDYNRPMPAVTLVRQAHIRPPGNDELPAMGSTEMWVKHDIEALLRRYGITSAPGSCALRILHRDGVIAGYIGDDLVTHVPTSMWRTFLAKHALEPPLLIRLNNVQLTHGCSRNPLGGTLVDFGHYTCVQRFDDHHLVTMVRDRPFNWGVFCRRDRPGWVAPDPDRRVDASALGPVALPAELCRTLDLRSSASERSQRKRMAGSLRIGLELSIAYTEGRISLPEMAGCIDDYVKRACRFEKSDTNLEVCGDRDDLWDIV